MTSFMQDCSHDVISRPPAAHLCNVRRLPASLSGACNVSSWSIVHSYICYFSTAVVIRLLCQSSNLSWKQQRCWIIYGIDQYRSVTVCGLTSSYSCTQWLVSRRDGDVWDVTAARLSVRHCWSLTSHLTHWTCISRNSSGLTRTRSPAVAEIADRTEFVYRVESFTVIYSDGKSGIQQ